MATFKPEEASGILRKFADELAPSAEYQKAGNLAAEDIFKALKTTGYIDRHLTAGSIGKHTSLPDNTKPDYDLVVFCNGKSPPFTSVVQEFKRILMGPKEKSGLKGPVKVEDEDEMKITVVYNGYKFDVCPATNLALKGKGEGDEKEKPDRATWMVQKQATYKVIEAASAGEQQKVAKHHNPGVGEAGVRVMKDLSASVHAIVRLAKFWARALDNVIGKLRGESLMIETIAVDAALRMGEKGKSESELVYAALKEFLHMMSDIPKLNCVLDMNYEVKDVSDKIKTERPLVLDPSSPYDNLAKNMTPVQIQVFEAAAKEILGKIDGIRAGGPHPPSVLTPVGTINAFKGKSAA